MTCLYHFEVYIPPTLTVTPYSGALRYSYHAREEARSDRYGHIDLPPTLDAGRGTLIEVETSADWDKGPAEVNKYVWRQPLDAERDLVLVVQPDGFVRTVWVNVLTDTHKTLNRHKYMHRPRVCRG